MNIAETVKAALKGSRKLRITFKKGAESADVNYLLGMERGGIIAFQNPMDKMVMMAVAQSGDWDGDQNRTTVLTLTDSFDAEWFIGRMRRPLESYAAA